MHNSRHDVFPVTQEPAMKNQEASSHYIEMSIKKHKSHGKHYRIVHVKVLDGPPVRRHTSCVTAKYPQIMVEDENIVLSPIERKTTDINGSQSVDKTFQKMGKFILKMIPE